MIDQETRLEALVATNELIQEYVAKSDKDGSQATLVGFIAYLKEQLELERIKLVGEE